ncbi:low temperature requirement protein A [Agromyces tropicus]|uniref:Low temperature requirement protein A n=1 Tax=Agromyces tropicus TaxID=555371 RepID=A0ABN2U8U3_9MICO
MSDATPRPGTRRILATRHALVRMTGRSATESHRVATPLELFYDLTIVVAFSFAGEEFAHQLAEGHLAQGLVAFVFAMFAVVWAWMSYTRFATAYDTDDWFVRLAVLVQMVGVVVLALGIPTMFEGMAEWHVETGTMVLGYVIMRIPLVALWARAAAQDPEHRRTSVSMAVGIAITQVAWVVLVLADPPIGIWFAIGFVLFLAEVGLPTIAQRARGWLPWHPHHLAERYGLLAIIAFGEVILGTTIAVRALVEEQGVTVDAITLGFAGVALTFGLWWTYFMLPTGELLEAFPRRATAYTAGQMVVYPAIAAVGAGLHVVALAFEHHVEIPEVAVMATIAVPLLVVLLAAYGLYGVVLGREGADPLHILLRSLSVLVVAVSLVMAWAGASLVACLLVIMFTPWVSVVTYEAVGHRHVQESLDRVLARR